MRPTRITIGGVTYESPRLPRPEEAPEGSFLRDLYAFLEEWQDDADTVLVHTSGSTGTPKPLRAEKARMTASARLTCRFLGLRPGDTALLCMPLRYIAGKMVVVRALTAGLNLLPVTPSGHPFETLEQAPVFAALIPMQVYNSLQVPRERELLRQVRHLIIGGGAIDASLGEALRPFPHAVWSTYGMTETLSHIALRRLNGPEASDWYTPFDNVQVRLTEEDTLLIHAPEVCPVPLRTNDIARLDARGRFRILGRKDNVINSGGVKIQIEQVEAALSGHLPVPFYITSTPHPKFGELVTLLAQDDGQHTSDSLLALCKPLLPPYWQPRRCVLVSRLPQTGTGKPDRAEARRMAARQ